MEYSLQDLIAKVLSGEATQEEVRTLQAACNQNAETQAEFESAKQIWKALDEVMPNFPVSKSAAWEKIQTRMAATESVLAPATPAINPGQKLRIFPVWARWAAAAALMGVGTTLLLQRTAATQEVVAQQNGTIVTLPDGSEVRLEKGARLQYAASFTKDRDVQLEGAGFFDVVRDPAHPFHIKGTALEVTVLGTSFLVDNPHQQVTVRTGKVQVRSGASETLLQAGQMATLTASGFEQTSADSNAFYLKTGKISFTNTSFEKTIADISRILEVPVQFDPSVDAAGRTQSITYTSAVAGTESILEDLCRITGYQWRKDGNAYVIYQAR